MFGKLFEGKATMKFYSQSSQRSSRFFLRIAPVICYETPLQILDCRLFQKFLKELLFRVTLEVYVRIFSSIYVQNDFNILPGFFSRGAYKNQSRYTFGNSLINSSIFWLRNLSRQLPMIFFFIEFRKSGIRFRYQSRFLQIFVQKLL